MRAALLIVLFALFAAVVFGNAVKPGLPNTHDNKVQNRLIKFNETTMVWMSQDQVDKMAKSECGAGRGFMDITEFQNLGSIPVKVHDIPINPSHQAEVNPLLPFLSKDAIADTITYLSTAFPTRYYRDAYGKSAAEWLISQYKAYSTSRNDVSILLFPNSFVQPSYIVRIEGSDPTLAKEVVVIGSHIDSISSGATAPGADDDASGTATVLEIFRVLVTNGFKPIRSVEFHGYAGEEAGLLGSQAIVSEYTRLGIDVVSMLQLDMTGYTRPGVPPTVGIVTDYTANSLSEFIRRLTETYTSATWSDTRCGYGCSDHASWTVGGYVAAFPFEGLFSNINPNIHSIQDLIGALNMDNALNFASIGLSYVVELSLN